MKPQDDPTSIPTPEPESDATEANAGEGSTRDRRDFLRRLGTMTFLTVAVFKGAVPAAAGPVTVQA